MAFAPPNDLSLLYLFQHGLCHRYGPETEGELPMWLVDTRWV